MKQFNRTIFLPLASLLSLLVLAVAPVAAQHGSDDSNTGSTDQSSSSGSGDDTSGDDSGGSAQTHHIVGGEAEVEDTNDDHGGGLRQRANQLLSEDRQNGKQHSQAQRQRACELRKAGIDNRFSTLGTKAQRFLDEFNSIFTKVQAYQTEHQLNVSDYDSLVATVTAKQTAATTATNALSALKGTTIDCSAGDPASTVATIKTATADARTSLQAYRSSLKDLIVALIHASNNAKTTTEGN